MQRAIRNGCSLLLCSVMKLCRGQEAGARLETVRPFCHCQGTHHLWYGTDAGAARNHSGCHQLYHERGRLRFPAGDRSSAGDRDGG